MQIEIWINPNTIIIIIVFIERFFICSMMPKVEPFLVNRLSSFLFCFNWFNKPSFVLSSFILWGSSMAVPLVRKFSLTYASMVFSSRILLLLFCLNRSPNLCCSTFRVFTGMLKLFLYKDRDSSPKYEL